MQQLRDIVSSLRLTRVHKREKDGKRIIVSTRRDMSRATEQPAGVKQFTRKANAKAKANARAKNKQARASRKRNRVHS